MGNFGGLLQETRSRGSLSTRPPRLARRDCVDAMRHRAIAQSGRHQALAQITLPCESCGSREEFKVVHPSPPDCSKRRPLGPDLFRPCATMEHSNVP